MEINPKYVYPDTTFLYHVPNLSKKVAPYENIVQSAFNLEQKSTEQALINTIKTLKSQLLPNIFRTRR